MASQSIRHPFSRNIMMIAWDDETLDMTVNFQKGGIVVYHGVDESTAKGFEGALSATAYLNAFVVGLFVEERLL